MSYLTHIPHFNLEILGVNPGNHPSDIKQAYLKLARQYHPDLNSSATAKASTQAINQAYKEFLAQSKNQARSHSSGSSATSAVRFYEKFIYSINIS